MQKKKSNYNFEVPSNRGLEVEKQAREPASSRPRPCVSLKNAQRILPICRSLLALVERKQTFGFLQKPPGLRLWFSLIGVQ